MVRAQPVHGSVDPFANTRMASRDPALVAGQIAFVTIRAVPIRLAIGALCAFPAGVAGFHAAKGLSQTGGAGKTWTVVFASIAAVVMGLTAWARIAVLSGPDDDGSDGSEGFSVGGTTREGR